MSTFVQLREGLSRAWESLTEGWRELVDRAGDALTRFHPPAGSNEIETGQAQLMRSSARWGVLAAEVTLDDDELLVSIEVPGMDPADFDIQVRDDLLVVRGHKRVERERKHGHYHVLERAYGAFERAVRLPVPVDDSSARARYRRGVLEVTLGRAATPGARRIPVTG